MNIGGMRHRITIQKKPDTIGRDSVGAESFSWSEHDVVWAEELPVSGREFLAAGQGQAQAVTKFRIRYLPSTTPHMRVLWGSRVFDIIHVENVNGRDKWMVLVCKEEV